MRNSMGWRFGGSAILLLLCAGGLPAQPAPGPELDAEAVNNSPLLFISPEARNMGPPEWVKPGVRISFYTASSNSPEGNYGLTEAADGEWEDPATGKRYRKEELSGSGGEGFAQLDVISVGDRAVAVAGNLYPIVKPGLPPTLSHLPMGGFIASAAGPADYWVHPGLLRAASQFHTPQFFVLKGTYPLGGQQVPSLCIVRREADSYSSTAYDLRSGILISSTQTGRGKLAEVRLPGDDPQRGHKRITIVKFIGTRELKTPGVRGRNPQWVQQLRAMHYAGQTNFRNPHDPYGPQMNFPTRMVVEFGKRGVNFAAYRARIDQNIGGMPQQAVVDGICGPGGGFWIDPEALSDLRTGMVLDEDPVTHIRTGVGQVMPGQAVTILVQGPGIYAESTYETVSGALLGLTVQQPTSGMTTMLRLQARQ